MHAKTFDLLRLLADANPHSGDSLARELDTSRAIIAKALNDLEGMGLGVSRLPARRYQLTERYECLDANILCSELNALAPRFRFELLDACTSTSTLLLERARGGEPTGSVIACELQSAGRGRRGKDWQSGLGGSLTFSLLWRFATGAAGLSGLSLAVGVAVARALDAVGVAGVQLKWPNDLLHAGRKLGGILVEVHSDTSGSTAAVIGIGLNVRLPAALRDAIAQPVTDVASLCETLPSRNLLLAVTLVNLGQVLDQFSAHGFAPLREEWTARHAHQGKAVTLSSGDGKLVAGRAAGVAADGALLIETARGVERFVSGELSLRANDPV